jgi:Holliday junction resolvase-like predicted endonuclease
MRDRTGLLVPDHGRPCRWVARIDEVPRNPVAPSRTRLARSGERLAATHLLETHGLEILALNHRIAVEDVRGELDVIAFDRHAGLLVVCEVKSRTGHTSTAAPSGALVALGPSQQSRIRRMTAVMLATTELRAARVRFDLVAVDLVGPVGRAELVHIADAW